MLQGWIVYFRLAEGRVRVEKLEAWILRHLRCIQWRQWKKPRTRFNKLLSFDVNRHKAARVAWGRGGPWFSSATSAMNFALKRSYFNELGWLGLMNMYNKFKNRRIRNRTCGGVEAGSGRLDLAIRSSIY